MPSDPVFITASDVSAAVYCELKWRQASARPELSTRELLERFKSSSAAGAERDVLARMLAARERQDEGTVAHIDHARAAESGGRSRLWVRICAALAALLALAAISWMALR